MNKKICPTNNWLSVDISEYENLNFENCAIDQVKNRIRIKKSIVDSSIVNLDAYNLSGVYYKNVNNFDLFWFYKNHSSSIKIINTDFNKSEIYYLISIDCRYNTITLCSNLYEDGFTILNLGQGILNRFIYNAYKYLGIDDVSKICECVLETFSHNRSPSKEFYITN